MVARLETAIEGQKLTLQSKLSNKYLDLLFLQFVRPMRHSIESWEHYKREQSLTNDAADDDGC